MDQTVLLAVVVGDLDFEDCSTCIEPADSRTDKVAERLSPKDRIPQLQRRLGRLPSCCGCRPIVVCHLMLPSWFLSAIFFATRG
ncbi:hypothetical protein [Gordonia aichiensis]|uniref:hypothetical protein n=1 Tax=Gordonia aichiensis TaxID=36820 RepID=UPI003267D8B9